MYHKSLEKIGAAAPFLLWFRSALPEAVQSEIRPYLAQPYQSALKVLQCCQTVEAPTIDTIVTQTRLSKDTTRQILKVLQAEGVLAPRNSEQRWQMLEPKEVTVRSELREVLTTPPASSEFTKPSNLSAADTTLPTLTTHHRSF